MAILFSTEGRNFLALDGGPQLPFATAISLIVNCDDQAEVDGDWRRLSEGGAKERRGFVADKFDVARQIAPRAPPDFLTGGNPEPANRVMKAALATDKLDIAAHRRAAGPTRKDAS